jgi:general stress protein 26
MGDPSIMDDTQTNTSSDSTPSPVSNAPRPALRTPGVNKLAHLIKDIKIAMMTTSGHDGELHSRPMATQQTDFDGTLWFFTGRSTLVADELHKRPVVNLAYANNDNSTYISVSGNVEITRDRSKMQELWSDLYKAWFPQGLQDPDLCLLRVDVTSAEYWDAPAGKMVAFLGMLKAAATGEPSESIGEHGEVDLSPKTRAAAASRGTSHDASEDIESHT